MNPAVLTGWRKLTRTVVCRSVDVMRGRCSRES
jgi:hypothetical protein